MSSSPARRSVGVCPLNSADLTNSSSRERVRPLVLVADDHAAVASVISRSLGGLAPVVSLGLLTRVVPVVAPLVLVADLDFDGVLSLDLLRDLMGAHPALEVIAWSGYDTGVMRQMVRAAGIPELRRQTGGIVARGLRVEVEAASSVLVGKGAHRRGPPLRPTALAM